MTNFPPGVQGRITRPITYTLTYVNGQFTYTERFALITCSKEYVNAAGGVLSLAVDKLSEQLAQISYVGAALAGIVKLSTLWYGYSSLNRDGSLTLQFAYHYCGTKAGGLDLTAKPVPGVDPKWWVNTVRGLMQGMEGLWLDTATGEKEDDLIESSVEVSTQASSGRAVLMGSQAVMQKSLVDLGIPATSIEELLIVSEVSIEGTRWWNCVEVDPGPSDPQGECDIGGGKKGIWRCVHCEEIDANGLIIWSRKLCWCSSKV